MIRLSKGQLHATVISDFTKQMVARGEMPGAEAEFRDVSTRVARQERRHADPTVGGHSWNVAVDPAARTAYVTSVESGMVWVIDLVTNTVIAKVPVPAASGVDGDLTRHTAYVTGLNGGYPVVYVIRPCR